MYIISKFDTTFKKQKIFVFTSRALYEIIVLNSWISDFVAGLNKIKMTIALKNAL